MEETHSPRWSTTTKLVVALTVTAVIAYLFIQYRNLVGPLMLALVLSYLAYPLTRWLNASIRIPWRLAAAIIHVLIILAVLGLLTWGGLAIFDQVSSLIRFLETAINNLPDFFSDISTRVYAVGPFEIDLSRLDLAAASNQMLNTVQPLLARIGLLVTNLASGIAAAFGWFLFMMLISYFILSETRGKTNRLIYIHLPGYDDDLNRMGLELGRIWNSFLRGQLILVTLTVLLYTVLLGVLGVRYYFGLAIVAGMARFIPYVGPFVAWSIYFLVSFFQGSTIFGLDRFPYALIIVAVAWFTDGILDNLVSPRVMASALLVHPAAVMVAALIGANLLGVVGVVLAAPVLASVRLLMRYIIRKLSDQDPWQGIEPVIPIQPIAPLLNGLRRVARALAALFHQGSTRFISAFRKNHPPRSSKDL